MIERIKANLWLFFIALSALGLGVVLYIVQPSFLINICRYLYSMVLLFAGARILTTRRDNYFEIVSGTIYVASAINILIYIHYILCLSLSALLLIYPIYKIIVSPYKKEAFKLEIYNFIIAVVMAIIGFRTVFAYGIASVLVVVAILLFIQILRKPKQTLSNIDKQEAIEVDYEEGD